MNPLVSSMIGSGVRWALNLLAGSGIIMSDEETTQLVSLITAGLTLAWTLYSNWQARKQQELAIDHARLAAMSNYR